MGLGLVGFLIIGLIAGWAAGKVVKGHGQGLVINLVVGVVGAVIGGWLFRELNIAVGGTIGVFVASFIGAALLLFLVGLVKK